MSPNFLKSANGAKRTRIFKNIKVKNNEIILAQRCFFLTLKKNISEGISAIALSNLLKEYRGNPIT